VVLAEGVYRNAAAADLLGVESSEPAVGDAVDEEPAANGRRLERGTAEHAAAVTMTHSPGLIAAAVCWRIAVAPSCSSAAASDGLIPGGTGIRSATSATACSA
jgi:hypothetical protein